MPDLEQTLVVTGVGLLTAAGDEPAALWERWQKGDTSAIQRYPEFEGEAYPSSLAGSLASWDRKSYFARREARDLDRSVEVALYAADRAIRLAGLKTPSEKAGFEADEDRFGVFYGTGYGGVRTMVDWLSVIEGNPEKSISPLAVPMATTNAACFHFSKRFGCRGTVRTYSTACSSGSLALTGAIDSLRLGKCDVALVAAADTAVFPTMLRFWKGLRVLSDQDHLGGAAFRPFDRDRTGFVMGDGASALVVETEAHAKKRGAKPLAKVLGYGNNLDGAGLTAPSVARQVACLNLALQDSGLDPDSVGHVVAHGSATALNDRVEAQAIYEVFGASPYVSESKPLYGHTMGASGLIESVLAIESLKRGRVPSIPNLENQEDEFLIQTPGDGGAPLSKNTCLINSFAFGGTNVCLAFQGLDA